MVRKNKKEVAREKVKKLFIHADEIFDKDSKLANRYVHLARKIAMKVNFRFPKYLKRKFCKHCYTYFKVGINCRIRTRGKKIVYYCFGCKNYMRFPLKVK